MAHERRMTPYEQLMDHACWLYTVFTVPAVVRNSDGTLEPITRWTREDARRKYEQFLQLAHELLLDAERQQWHAGGEDVD